MTSHKLEIILQYTIYSGSCGQSSIRNQISDLSKKENQVKYKGDLNLIIQATNLTPQEKWTQIIETRSKQEAKDTLHIKNISTNSEIENIVLKKRKIKLKKNT